MTNPPYVPQRAFPKLPPEVRDYEPQVALDGGADGLDFYRRALPGAHLFLKSHGWFLAEIGHEEDNAIDQLARENPDIDSLDFVKDLAGIKRVFKARKK